MELWCVDRLVLLESENEQNVIGLTVNPFAELDLQEAIDLEWTLKDIKAKRWLLCPVDPAHLKKLTALCLAEISDDRSLPVLTNAGMDALDRR
jgi:hypothetical protein